MFKQQGFGMVGIIVTVVAVSLLAVTGYLITREAAQEKTSNSGQQATTSANDSINEVQAEATANWKTYSNAEHGYSFDYPADWKVQELGEDKQRDTPQVTLLNAQGDRRLSLFDDALMGCEQQPTGDEASTIIQVGDNEMKIVKNCNEGWGFYQFKPAKGDAMITITPGDFMETDDEIDARLVLKSVKGLTPIQ